MQEFLGEVGGDRWGSQVCVLVIVDLARPFMWLASLAGNSPTRNGMYVLHACQGWLHRKGSKVRKNSFRGGCGL